MLVPVHMLVGMLVRVSIAALVRMLVGMRMLVFVLMFALRFAWRMYMLVLFQQLIILYSVFVFPVRMFFVHSNHPSEIIVDERYSSSFSLLAISFP